MNPKSDWVVRDSLKPGVLTLAMSSATTYCRVIVAMIPERAV
jgi:hypothetical protein